MHLYENRTSRFDCYAVQGIRYFPHLHKHVELVYIMKGEMRLVSNGTAYHLTAGDIFLAFPNTIHEYDAADDCLCGLWIFDSNLIEDFSATFRKKTTTIPVLYRDQVHADVHMAVEQFSSREELRMESALSKAFLSVILAHVLPALSLVELNLRENLDWMHQVLQYLNQHFTEQLSLQRVADEIGISKYHLSRTFRERIGCSIPNYINTLRVDQAIQQLKSTEKSITEIAYECGFESMTTFFRAFRQLGKESPKQYRKNVL